MGYKTLCSCSFAYRSLVFPRKCGLKERGRGSSMIALFLLKRPYETNPHSTVQDDSEVVQDNHREIHRSPEMDQNKEELGIFECSKNSTLPTPHFPANPASLKKKKNARPFKPPDASMS